MKKATIQKSLAILISGMLLFGAPVSAIAENDAENLEERISILESENADLQNKVEELEAENEELRGEQQISENETETLQTEIIGTEYTDSATIKAVQEALNAAGYECGTADGVSGSKTVDAINAYEEENGLNVNGVITDELLVSLGVSNIEDSDDEIETLTEVEEDDGQITFRNIPWGTSYTDVSAILSDFNIWSISGEGYKTYSIDDITLGDYKGLRFENSDINIIGYSSSGKTEVAGYTTSEISLYFAYTPVNGILTRTENDSAFYGARYEFEPSDLDGMKKDMTEKLTLLYGEPTKVTSGKALYNVDSEYTYWYGENDTALVMRADVYSEDTTGLRKDKLYLSYVWLKGDELLQEASDILGQNNKDAEAEIFGNGLTDGL